MAYERTQPPYNSPSRIPEGLGWETLIELDGDELETKYRHILEELSKKQGMLGIIFRKAINKIQNPAHDYVMRHNEQQPDHQQEKRQWAQRQRRA